MNDVELYEQLLGLTAPWRVVGVHLDPAVQQVRGAVAAAPDARWACPECGQPCPGYDHREERAWRQASGCANRSSRSALPRSGANHTWRGREAHPVATRQARTTAMAAARPMTR